MDKAIKEADRTILIISSEYFNSKFTSSEWASVFASDPMSRNGKLVPVLIGDAKPDGILKSIVYIDLTGLNEEDAKERLLNGIKKGRSKPATKPLFPHSSRDGPISVLAKPVFPIKLQYVQFSIEYGDIKSIKADVIALKYAQEFYGADLDVVKTLAKANINIDTDNLIVGRYKFIKTRGVIGSDYALFVDVPNLYLFKYNEIRNFAVSVLSIVSSDIPNAKHIAMTIHGPGYGLDEEESFLSQLAGCLQVIEQSGNIPLNLEKITIVEKDINRVERLRKVLYRYFSENNRLSTSKVDNYLYIPKESYNYKNWRNSFDNANLVEMTGIKSNTKPHILLCLVIKKWMVYFNMEFKSLLEIWALFVNVWIKLH